MFNNVVISVELVGLPFSYDVDSPASGFGKQIDLEHPNLEKMPMKNKDKGKTTEVSYESTLGKQTISHLDMLLEIVSHGLKFSYRF